MTFVTSRRRFDSGTRLACEAPSGTLLFSYDLRKGDDMRTLELAWLAGLLEGDGCFHLSQGRYPLLVLGMTDRDTVERAQEVCGGVGSISERPAGTKGYKPMWRWDVCSVDAIAVMMTVYGMMSTRRQARIREVIEGYRSAPGRAWNGQRRREESSALEAQGLRRCSVCDEVKSLSDYAKVNRKSQCRACRLPLMKEARERYALSHP